MSINSNGVTIQVGKLPHGAGQLLDSGNVTSTALASGLYLLSAVSNTYYKGYANATAAAAETVTTTGATVGAYLTAGAADKVSVNANEVIKIDSAGALTVHKIG